RRHPCACIARSPDAATMTETQQTYPRSKLRLEPAHSRISRSIINDDHFHVGITTLSSGVFTLQKESDGCRCGRQRLPLPWTNRGAFLRCENDLLDHHHAPTRSPSGCSRAPASSTSPKTRCA